MLFAWICMLCSPLIHPSAYLLALREPQLRLEELISNVPFFVRANICKHTGPSWLRARTWELLRHALDCPGREVGFAGA